MFMCVYMTKVYEHVHDKGFGWVMGVDQSKVCLCVLTVCCKYTIHKCEISFSFRPEDFVKDEYKRHMTKKRPKRRYTIWDLLAQQLLVNVIQILLCVHACVCMCVCVCVSVPNLIVCILWNARGCVEPIWDEFYICYTYLACGANFKRQSEIDIVSVLCNKIRKCICHVLVWDIVSMLNNKNKKYSCHVLVWDIVAVQNNKINSFVTVYLLTITTLESWRPL